MLLWKELCQFLHFKKWLLSAPDSLHFSCLYLAGIQTVLDAEVTEGTILILYKFFSLRQQRVSLEDARVFFLGCLFIGCAVTAAVKETIKIRKHSRMCSKSDLIKVEHFSGTSNSQKTYRTLPFRTVELSSTDHSGSDGKAGQLTPGGHSHSHSISAAAWKQFGGNSYCCIFWIQRKRIWLFCFSMLKTQRQTWENQHCRY